MVTVFLQSKEKIVKGKQNTSLNFKRGGMTKLRRVV